eukprot:4443797-Pleurochrysis_carterae.AAC.3
MPGGVDMLQKGAVRSLVQPLAQDLLAVGRSVDHDEATRALPRAGHVVLAADLRKAVGRKRERPSFGAAMHPIDAAAKGRPVDRQPKGRADPRGGAVVPAAKLAAVVGQRLKRPARRAVGHRRCRANAARLAKRRAFHFLPAGGAAPLSRRVPFPAKLRVAVVLQLERPVVWAPIHPLDLRAVRRAGQTAPKRRATPSMAIAVALATEL